MGIIHSTNYSITKKIFNKIFIQQIWKLFIQKNYSFFWKIDYRPGLPAPQYCFPSSPLAKKTKQSSNLHIILPSRNPFGDNNDINFTDINASMRKPPLQYPVMPPLTTFPCRQSRPTTRKRKPPTCGTNPRKKMRKQYPTLKDELGENEGNFW